MLLFVTLEINYKCRKMYYINQKCFKHVYKCIENKNYYKVFNFFVFLVFQFKRIKNIKMFVPRNRKRFDSANLVIVTTFYFGMKTKF